MTISRKRIYLTDAPGFTLTEAMIAVVLLGIAAAGVLLPFSGGAVVRAEGMRLTLAAKLAGDLMEEIVSSPSEAIVSAYDGYVEPTGQVKDAEGQVFADPMYANFSREASCQYVYVPQESGMAEPKFIRVAVRVYYRGKQAVVINRLIAQ